MPVDPPRAVHPARVMPWPRRYALSGHVVFRVLVLLVVGVHFAYLGYLVSGGFLAWRWPRSFVLHALAVAWAVVAVTLHVPCPLTWTQNQLQVLAGERPLADTFINTYVRGVFYPHHQRAATQLVLAVVILVSWIGLAVRVRAARARARGRGGDTVHQPPDI